MKRVMNICLLLLLFLVSLINITVGSRFYQNEDFFRAFYVNDIINAILGIGFVFALLKIKNKEMILGLYLIIIYSVLPVVLGWKQTYLKFLPAVIILLALSLFFKGLPSISLKNNYLKRFRITNTIIILVFSLIFLARGFSVLLKPVGAFSSNKIVSISDIFLSIVWIGLIIVGFIKREKKKGYDEIVLFSGSILFLALLLYLIINPTIKKQEFKFIDFITISLMSLFFVIPYLKISLKRMQ